MSSMPHAAYHKNNFSSRKKNVKTTEIYCSDVKTKSADNKYDTLTDSEEYSIDHSRYNNDNTLC